MKLKTFIKRKVALLGAVLLASSSVLPVLMGSGVAHASTITERKITLSSSAVSAASTNYVVSFKPVTSTGNAADDIKGIVVDFCTSPIVGIACTNPTGMSGIATSGTINVAHTGATGTPVAFTANDPGGGIDRLVLTDATGLDVITPANTISFTLTATNPSTLGTFYARILTYNTTGGATSYTDTVPGTHLDDGGVALSTANQLTVSARVQEQLGFCVGTTTVDDRTTSLSSDCSVAFTGSAGNTIDMGVLDGAAIYVSGPSNAASADNGVNGAAMVRTNAINGVVVSYYPEAGSGTEHVRTLRVSGATCIAGSTPSIINTDQCFNSSPATQVAMVAGVEQFGMTIAGTNCGSTTSYSTCTTNLNANLLRDGAYNADAGAAYNDGSGVGATGYAWHETSTAATIASSSSVVDDEVLMLKFAGTANITTPTGSYGVTTTYIATATF